ncbi:hypothetical protein ABFS82_05G052100 [Erythranthe guttata]|uniref:CASP-like protein PIMP1 n=1 Tax=Erythranthe guttata TaxID=4155 RepID=UPI00064DA351|nr:PREDICTED: CASP-like protein PIMP1 [Erythranthe guttata]|eukprot:XP_012845998.1 PREDICTED: CASP-like protein PIMP1 [Erythranthe guttata]
MSHINSQYDDVGSDKYGTKFPKTSLTARVVTLVSLIVSAAVLKTNTVSFDDVTFLSYKTFHSYKYTFYVTIFGIVYTLLQLPSAIYYMKQKTHLISSFGYLKFNFYADKIVVFLLATGAGAAFGLTMDLKKLDSNGNDSKVQDFLTIAYIPSAFLLVGGIAAGISSVHSSLALTKTN